MISQRFKLLVFDWDGTLVDSIERIVVSLQAASQQVCQSRVSASDARNVIGLGLREAIEKLHPLLESGLISKIAQTYKHHYLNENTLAEDPYAGVITQLTDLKQQGYLIAVATGKSRTGFERSLKKFELDEWFHTSQCAGENRSKPHPEMLLKILDELKIDAENAVMIGDSKHDLIMAGNARVDSIAVTQGVHTADELSKYKPLVCLDKITDLNKFLRHT